MDQAKRDAMTINLVQINKIANRIKVKRNAIQYHADMIHKYNKEIEILTGTLQSLCQTVDKQLKAP